MAQSPHARNPRTADGKPNLSAPAPKASDGKPDLSGLWRLGVEIGIGANITADPPADVQPWVAALSPQRLEEFGKDDPEITGCLPGGPRHITRAGLSKIVQTPGLMLILYEDLAYRQIFLDGRPLPPDPNPNWMGYSAGHWEGDTLVVESAGFNDRTWLDFAGHGHTEALRMTERFRRRDFGHMDLQVDDRRSGLCQALDRYRGRDAGRRYRTARVRVPGKREGPQHLVGRTSEEKAVTVAPDVLAQYVGVYSEAKVGSGGRNVFTITLVNGELLLDMQGKGKVPMIPLSETTFSPRLLGTYQFVRNEQGVVTQMLVHSAEEVLTAVRRP